MQKAGINAQHDIINHVPDSHTKKYRRLLVGVLFLVYTLIQSYSITQLTINYDEESFLQYGITLLKGQANKDINRFDSKLPITALNALPRAVQQLADPALKKNNPEEDIIAGRFISLMASILLGILIYSWSIQWYGFSAGLYSLIFYLLCPNFLAHGIFLSSDIYACLFIALTIYFFSKFWTTGKNRDFLFFSLCFALGQISKFSLLHMIPVVGIIAAIKWYTINEKRSFFSKRHLALGLTFLLVNWLVISWSHLFYDLFFPLDKYAYRSQAFQSVTGFLGHFAGYVYVPLPSSYFRSIDLVLYFDNLGGGVPGALNGKPYILGQFSTHGFWYYYLVSSFYKIPIPFIVIILSSLVLYAIKCKRSSFLEREVFLAVPFLYYLVYMSFLYSTQVGIRHFMIVFPFLFVFAGFFFREIISGSYKKLILLLIIWQLFSVGAYFPHFLPYTNEFILKKKNAYKKIADSNLCYREGGGYLKKYMASHKNAIYRPAGPVTGIVVVEVNDFLGIQDDSIEGTYDWLKGYEPVDHIHSQYLIFDIPVKK